MCFVGSRGILVSVEIGCEPFVDEMVVHAFACVGPDGATVVEKMGFIGVDGLDGDT